MTRKMTDADYREMGLPVPDHMREVEPRQIVFDVREFYEGFRNPGASPADRCEACGDDEESTPFCEGCGACYACCNCTPTDCDCSTCEERRSDRNDCWYP